MNPTQNYLCPQHGGSFTAKCDICGGDCEIIENPITDPPAVQPPGASATGAQAETPEVMRSLFLAIEEVERNFILPADSSDEARGEAIHLRPLFNIARMAKQL